MAHSVDEPLVEYVMEPIEEDGEKDTLYTVTWKHTGETLKVRTKNSVYHGKGLFCAQEMIPAGSFIDHYHGITMSSATAHIRHPEIDDSFSVYSSDVIIPHKYIPGRFANDSVKLPENDQDPIIRTQEVNAAFEEIESGTVVIHALKDIHEGEEILISYGDWYWRGVMFERAGFEDAPTRFDVLTTPQDFARQKRWMKTCGWTTMPEDVRIVKVFRKDGRPHPDYYLVKARTRGIWRSAPQYRKHLDAEKEGISCSCEVCGRASKTKQSLSSTKRKNETSVLDPEQVLAVSQNKRRKSERRTSTIQITKGLEEVDPITID